MSGYLPGEHQHFESGCIRPDHLVNVINSCEKLSVKTHVGEHGSHASGMAKCVKLPAHGWNIVKILLQEIMAKCHLVDHVFIICCAFIVSWLQA